MRQPDTICYRIFLSYLSTVHSLDSTTLANSIFTEFQTLLQGKIVCKINKINSDKQPRAKTAECKKDACFINLKSYQLTCYKQPKIQATK